MNQDINLNVKVTADTAGATKATTAVERFQQSLGGSVSKMQLFSRIASGLGGAFAGFTALGIAKKIIDIGASFQTLRLQLETATGSSRAAERAFAWIKDFATKTPFEVQNLVQAFVRLRNVGFEPTKALLTTLGDAAGAFGEDITDLVRTFTSAAFREYEGLKRLGIIARQDGKQVLITFRGVTTAVKNTSESVFNELVRISGTAFKGGMERASRTFSQAISNLKDSFSNFADAVARSGILDSLRDQIKAFGAWIDQNNDGARTIGQKMIGAVERLSDAVRFLVKHWDELKGIVAVFLAFQVISWANSARMAFFELAARLVALGAASDAAKAKLIALRGVLLTFASAAVIGALLYLNEKVKAWKERMQADIEEVVRQANLAGQAMQNARSGGKLNSQDQYLAENAELNRLIGERATLQKRIEEANARAVRGAGGRAMMGSRQTDAEQVRLTNAELQESLRLMIEEKRSLDQRVKGMQASQAATVAARIATGEWNDETDESLIAQGYVKDAFWGWIKPAAGAFEELDDEAKKYADTLREVGADLEQQRSDQERLSAAMRKGKNVYAETVILLEAEAKARQRTSQLKGQDRQRAFEAALALELESDAIERQAAKFAELTEELLAHSGEHARATERLKERTVERVAALKEEMDAANAAAKAHRANNAEAGKHDKGTPGSRGKDPKVFGGAGGRGPFSKESDAESEKVKDIWRRTFQDIGAVWENTVHEWVQTGEVSWKQMGKSLLAILTQTLLDLLKRWLAHLAQKVMANNAANAKIAASNAAAGSTGGAGATGGGGGWMSSLGSMFGMGGGATGASTGGSSAAASGGMAAAGWALAIVAVIAILAKWASDAGTPMEKAKLGADDGDFTLGKVEGRTKARGKVARYMGEQVVSYLNSLLDELGAVVMKAGDVAIGRKGRGKKAKHFVDYIDAAGRRVTKFFSDIEDAISFAAVQALKTSDLRGLSPELATAIKNSTAEKIEQLEADIDVAKEVLRSRLGDVGFSVTEIFRDAAANIEHARELGLATDDLVESRNREIQAVRESVLGLDMSAAQRLRDLASLRDGLDEINNIERERLEEQTRNARRQLELAELGGGAPGGGGSRTAEETDRMLRDMATGAGSSVEELREQLARYEAELAALPARLSDDEINMSIFDTLYQYVEGSRKYEQDRLKWARMKVDLEFQAIKLQLLVLGKWEEFAGLWTDARNAAMRAAGKRPGKGGGGSGVNMNEWLDDNDRQLRRAGMTEFGRQLDELNEKYDEAAKNAGKNKTQLARVNEQREREIKLLKEQALIDLKNDVAAFGPAKDPFAQVREGADDLRKRLRDGLKEGTIRWKEFKVQMAAVNESERERLELLRQQLAADLFGGLAGMVKDEKLRQELLHQQALINYNLQLAEFNARYQLLKAEGALTDEQIALIDRALNDIRNNPPVLGGDTNPFDDELSGARSAWDKAREADEEARRLLEEMAADRKDLIDSLSEYGELQYDPVTRQLRALNKEFAKMREEAIRLQVPLEQVNDAYQLAIMDFWKTTLQGVQDFLKEMQFSESSPLTGAQQYYAAQNEFRDSYERLRGGDLSQIEKVTSLAERYLTLGQDFTAGEAFRGIFSEVQNALSSILGLAPPTAAPTGAPSAPMFMEAPTVVEAVENAAMVQVTTLREMQVTLQDIEHNTADVASFRSSPISVKLIA
jgi:hypothetical protein